MKPLTFEDALREAVGYLNFSSGLRSARFFAAINRLFLEAGGIDPELFPSTVPLEISPEAVHRFVQLLREAPRRLQKSAPTFRDVCQAECVIALALDAVIPAYREFHRDLLGFHHPEFFYQPFFVARILEAVLQAGEPWEEQDRIVDQSLRIVNDYVGYRPVPVLQTRRYEPYPHERVCPMPLFVRGAGVACSPYAPLVARTIKILELVPEAIARQADFDFEQLEELAFDPRALDFQHPLQHRPNYVYGSWDLHRLDNSGCYCRYVAQQAILDFLSSWVSEQLSEGASPEDTIFQAAGVFASTILMAMGLTGGHPSAIPSTENLGRLVKKIALYRERFYEWLWQQAPESVQRLLDEQVKKYRSHFAEVRRALNRRLNDYRAQEAHRGRFVQLMAEFGQPEIVDRQLDRIRGATGRMTSRIYAAIHACRVLVEKGELEEAARRLPEIFGLVLRGIDCGGLVDPWNVLGFGGMFPLAPSPEDSIPDERIGQLIMLMERLFDLHARVMKAGAAVGKSELVQAVNEHLRQLADWWDQFATTKVSEVVSFSGRLAQQSAEAVANAIAAWYQAGAASGDIAFWRQHVAHFPSAKAFVSAAETLLDHGDLISALALLIHWASLGEEVGIREGSDHLPGVAARWIHSLWENSGARKPPAGQSPQRFPQPQTPEDKWQWTKRLFDYLEANAIAWWQVPNFRLGETVRRSAGPDDSAGQSGSEFAAEEEDMWNNILASAYEGVTFRESALDGIDSDLMERGLRRLQSELAEELKRLSDHAFFLAALGGLWQYTALQILAHPELDVAETVSHWAKSAGNLARGLERLAEQVLRFRILPDSMSVEDMNECGMRLQMKEVLLSRIVEACVKLQEARWMLAVVLPEAGWELFDADEKELVVLGQMFRTVVTQGPKLVHEAWKKFVPHMRRLVTSYVPIEKGGKLQDVILARVLSQLLGRLLVVLCRRGHPRYALQMVRDLQIAEKRRRSHRPTVTQLATLYAIAAESLVRSIVHSARTWSLADNLPDNPVREVIGTLLQTLKRLWEKYSRSVLVSPVNRLQTNSQTLEKIYQFVNRFGRDLFTQTFLSYANLLTILRMGTANYIRQVIEQSQDVPLPELFERVREGTIPLTRAARLLTAVIEPILFHYTYYIDYNASTVESDRGENLHILLRFLDVVGLVEKTIWRCQPYLIVYRTLLRLGHEDWAEEVGQMFEQEAQDVWWAGIHLHMAERVTGVELTTVRRVVNQAVDYPLRLERLRLWASRLAGAQSSEEARAAAAAIEQLAEHLLQEPRETGFEEPEWLDVIRQEFQRREKVFSLLEGNLQESPVIQDVPLKYSVLIRQCGRR